MGMHANPPGAQDLAALFQQHRDGLAGAVRGVLGPRGDVQEVLQEAFLRALRALSRGQVRGELVGFAFVVTLNTARDFQRKGARAARSRPIEEVPAMQLTANEPEPGHGLATAEAVRAARAAIERLEDRAKDVFFLRVAGGLSFEAAAGQLGIPVGTAKTRMRNALLELRRSLASFAPAAEPASGRDPS